MESEEPEIKSKQAFKRDRTLEILVNFFEEKVMIWKQLIFTEEPEYEYYYEYIYEEDLPQFSENLPPSTTFETETTLPTKQTLLETSPRFSEPPHTASNGKYF